MAIRRRADEPKNDASEEERGRERRKGERGGRRKLDDFVREV
jgi:hypothetical protein